MALTLPPGQAAMARLRARRPMLRRTPPGQAAMGRGIGVGVPKKRVLPPRPGAMGAAAAPKPPVDPFLTKANALAGGLYSPLLAQLGASRAAAEANARAAYEKHAGALEKGLQATAAPIASAFDQGIAQSAAVNQAVSNRLSGQGSSASQGLAAQLAQIGADPAGAAQLAQSYQGAGNAGFVKDSADLQHLIGRRAEAGSYQGKLPGIGRLTAAQALEQALSEGRGVFAEEEADLRRGAVEQAGSIYSGLRSEAQADKEQKQRIKETLIETAQRERASIRALQMAATSDAEKRKYDAQEKALDRQLKADIANLNAQTRLATDNPPAAKPKTSAPNRKFNPDGSKNPNYTPPSGPKSSTDSWLTPGSAKRDRAVQAAARAVIGDTGSFNQTVLNRLKQFPGSPDQIINTAINQALRAQGIPVNHASAKKIRQAVRQRLSGKKWVDKNGDEWTFVA